MSRYVRCAAVLLAAAMCAEGAAALTPQEVAVVANANSDESVELGRSYARLRGIPQENIVLVKTTTRYAVSRADFESQIHAPLRKALVDRNIAPGIRSIALMWGVPVRVMGPHRPSTGPPTRGADPVKKLYQIAASKAHYRLAIAHKLLGTVGKEFPEPRTDKFIPLGKLFASPIRAPTPPLTDFEVLQKDINIVFAQRQLKLLSIRDAAKRRIASRQLMALHLDAGGLRGLIDFIETEKPPEAPNVEPLRKLLAEAERQLGNASAAERTKAAVEARLKLLDSVGGAILLFSDAREKAGGPIETTRRREEPKSEAMSIKAHDASVDSELALLWWPEYRTDGWMKNPLFWRIAPQFRGKRIPQTLMTARIDGPTRSDAMRIIKASVATERVGLKGTFYIDAGGKVPDYDKHLTLLHKFVTANTKMKVVLDDLPTVFQRNSCPEAALYVGWYSLRKYVPAFLWTKGAVGWHIASFEAQGLRNPDSQTWCPKMIQNGVAATLGPVGEPRLGAFPAPEEFFALLLTGKYTLAECYWRTIPTVSWRMTLIGDPLYNPFYVNPQLSMSKLPKGLAP